jgi:protein TonB
MRLGWVFGIACALVLHAGVFLFGGLLLPNYKKDNGTYQQVDLLDNVDAEKEKPDEPKPPKTEEVEGDTERPPDAAEVMRNLDVPPIDNTPALEAASLSAIEAALNGQVGGGGDFAEALGFASGGRIGGTGKAGALDETLEGAFSLAEIDQKPRPILQSAPPYPAELRDKKLEGVVTIIFLVDSSGRVAEPRVEKSTHPAFDKPALEAVRHWKFEPAIRAGQRVACKMRVPIRFQPR